MSGAEADRQQRLAAALRENLKRRKAAARVRETPVDPAPEAENDGAAPAKDADGSD